MKQFKTEINNLELRSCDIHLTLQGDHVTAEIVQWIPRDEGKPYCIVIAFWRKDSEGFYMHFVGDRPFDPDVNMLDFWGLAKRGQKILNKVFESDEE